VFSSQYLPDGFLKLTPSMFRSTTRPSTISGWACTNSYEPTSQSYQVSDGPPNSSAANETNTSVRSFTKVPAWRASEKTLASSSIDAMDELLSLAPLHQQSMCPETKMYSSGCVVP
jgi:hypothetical protein